MLRREFLRATTLAIAGGLSRRVCAAKARVVVVGGGFAGATCAHYLRRWNPAIQVSLIDPDDRYVTCPMSNSVLVGLRDLSSISVSRHGLVRAGVRYVHDRAIAIDTQRRRVRLARGATLVYDRLVLAPGIRFLWGKPEGYDEAAAQLMPHAWQAGAQTEILMAQLRAMRDGGVVAISVPTGPMRCPPAPFERASLIANYLKQNKPRSKVLILDGNNHFPKQDVFTDAWDTLYPGMIEWIPVVQDGAVIRVAPRKMTLYTTHGSHQVAVANIIPPQAPGWLAVETGLASDHGWCPIKSATFESALVANVHVIGDACIADPMPKSASAANGQAKQCALAIVAALAGRAPPDPSFDSVCYSMLARENAFAIHGHFRSVDGEIQQVEESAEPGTGEASGAKEAANAEAWYKNIVADSFGA